MARAGVTGAAAGGDTVVLVHGLWLSGWVMIPLARRLRACGLRPCRFSYPSVRADLRQNAAALRRYAAGVPGDTVHFVGHSLGGIVILAMLREGLPARAGRIVTLSSPHRGSRAAASLARCGLGRRVLGRSIADLQREPPVPELCRDSVGLIQGTLPLGLGRLIASLERPHDGVVSVAEMELPGAGDRVRLPVSHLGMLFSPAVAAHACRFLRHGRFLPCAGAHPPPMVNSR